MITVLGVIGAVLSILNLAVVGLICGEIISRN